MIYVISKRYLGKIHNWKGKKIQINLGELGFETGNNKN